MNENFVNLPSRVKIGNKLVGDDEPIYFIAEIGNNHNGDYYLAKKTIEEAVKAGADAVKFQRRTVKEVFAKELYDKPQTKDQVLGKTYGEYRENLELSDEDLIKLKKFTEDLGATFFVTPFDKKSVDFLESINIDLYKISSFDVTNIPLVEYIAKKGKSIVLSVGMSEIDEVDEAINIIIKHNPNLVILHCVAIYPPADETINLANIKFLKERYSPLPIGYSGHEKGYLPTLMACGLGAKCIERHFTLDKSLPGPDHGTVSVEPLEFKDMVEQARRIDKIIGKSEKSIHPDEKRTRDKHAKSIVTTMPIPAGSTITIEMLTCKSPGYGLKPNMIERIIGKKVKIDLSEDVVITQEHIEDL